MKSRRHPEAFSSTNRRPSIPWRALWRRARAATSPLGELSCALLFERSLSNALPPVENRLGASIRLADEADLESIWRLYADDPWLWPGKIPGDRTGRRLYVERLRRGERCYIAQVDGQLAHVNWTCSDYGEALPGYPLLLHPGEVYTTDAFTPVAFRGKAIHAFVLSTMLKDARDRGAHHAFTLGSLDRPDALKGLCALGWQEVGRVVYFLPRGMSRALFTLRMGMTAPLFRP